MGIIHEVIECVREIVWSVSATPSWMQAFNKIAQDMGLSTRKGLPLEDATR